MTTPITTNYTPLTPIRDNGAEPTVKGELPQQILERQSINRQVGTLVAENDLQKTQQVSEKMVLRPPLMATDKVIQPKELLDSSLFEIDSSKYSGLKLISSRDQDVLLLLMEFEETMRTLAKGNRKLGDKLAETMMNSANIGKSSKYKEAQSMLQAAAVSASLGITMTAVGTAISLKGMKQKVDNTTTNMKTTQEISADLRAKKGELSMLKMEIKHSDHMPAKAPIKNLKNESMNPDSRPQQMQRLQELNTEVNELTGRANIFKVKSDAGELKAEKKMTYGRAIMDIGSPISNISSQGIAVEQLKEQGNQKIFDADQQLASSARDTQRREEEAVNSVKEKMKQVLQQMLEGRRTTVSAMSGNLRA